MHILSRAESIGQKPTNISSVNTKQQSRLKYSHSLPVMSISFHWQTAPPGPELAQLSDAQLNSLEIDTDTSTTLNSFDSLSNTLLSESPNTRFYSNNRIAGNLKSIMMPISPELNSVERRTSPSRSSMHAASRSSQPRSQENWYIKRSASNDRQYVTSTMRAFYHRHLAAILQRIQLRQ